MDYKNLIYSVEDAIALVTLNRPEVRNALNDELLEELLLVFHTVERDDGVRVVIITGNEKAFSGGADIRKFKAIDSPIEAYSFLTRIQKVINRLEDIPKPTIAAIAGTALGGGTEISLACDLRIAAENALFGLPEINLGIVPGCGGTQRLPRAVGRATAGELLFTGRPVGAEEALAIGLVNKVVPVVELMKEAYGMARVISSKPPLAVRMIKACLKDGLQMGLPQALEYEGRCAEFLLATEDHREGVRAFLEKRKPDFKGK